MGVALDLDRERSESRFVSKVLSVEDALSLRVAVEELHYWVSPAVKRDKGKCAP